jgi:hypothetical protein
MIVSTCCKAVIYLQEAEYPYYACTACHLPCGILVIIDKEIDDV